MQENALIVSHKPGPAVHLNFMFLNKARKVLVSLVGIIAKCLTWSEKLNIKLNRKCSNTEVPKKLTEHSIVSILNRKHAGETSKAITMNVVVSL